MFKQVILAAAIATFVAPAFAANVDGSVKDGFGRSVKVLKDYPMHDGVGSNGGGGAAAGAASGSTGGSTGGNGGSGCSGK